MDYLCFHKQFYANKHVHTNAHTEDLNAPS